MNSIKAKFIKVAKASIIFGLIATGVAFASGVSFQNVPIINSQGMPVVQIVVGSKASISDGVVAGNIAAVIGNLAYYSENVNASINQTQLSCKISGSSPEVYLNEVQSISSNPSAYTFSSIIGSVLNNAVLQGNYQNTKTLQSNSQYAFQETTNINNNPSPFTNIGFQGSPLYPSEFGGIQFNSFDSNGYDNLIKISLPSINSNENQAIYVAGFPAYNSQTKSLELNDANLVYQISFTNPIVSGDSFEFLGTNYTIMSINPTQIPTTQNFTTTGYIQTAKYSNTVILDVGHNMTLGNFTINLGDLSQPNTQGISEADILVYYGNTLTNNTAIYPNQTATFTVNGKTLYVKVDSTFAGLYDYERYAKISAYADVMNFTSEKPFMNDSNYNTQIWFIKNSNGENGVSAIEIYGNGNNYQNLGIGSTMSIPTSNPAYELDFIGQSLSPNDYDTLSMNLTTKNYITYPNQGLNSVYVNSSTNITEPAILLNVKSAMQNAFTIDGTQVGNFSYILTPYLEATYPAPYIPANQFTTNATLYAYVYFNKPANQIFSPSLPQITFVVSGLSPSNYSISQTITVSPTTYNYTYDFVKAPFTQMRIFKSLELATPNPIPLNIQLYESPNGTRTDEKLIGMFMSLYQPLTIANNNGKIISMNSTIPIQYNIPNGNNYNEISLFGNYSGYHLNITEYPVPFSNQVDKFESTITTNAFAPYGLPYSQANFTALNYLSTQNNLVNAPIGFITEKGSVVSSMSSQTLNLKMAKSTDLLKFAVLPATQSITPTTKEFGPYGIGMATNIPNVSIANVIIPNQNCSILGTNSIKAIPSISSADIVYKLSNIVSNPLVVLDTNANLSKNLILIGSGFVNSISKQVQEQYGINFTPNTTIVKAFGNKILVAGYTANQTINAGNEFIEQLLADASN